MHDCKCYNAINHYYIYIGAWGLKVGEWGLKVGEWVGFVYISKMFDGTLLPDNICNTPLWWCYKALWAISKESETPFLSVVLYTLLRHMWCDQANWVGTR